MARIRTNYIRAVASKYPNFLTQAEELSHEQEIAQALADHYSAVIPYFSDMVTAQLKSGGRREIKRVMMTDFMRQFIAGNALKKAKLIAQTDKADVQRQIDLSIEEGIGVEETARNIRKASGLTPFRAATVARTETHAAASYGSIETVREQERELGIKVMKIWQSTFDDRTRDDHKAMNNVAVMSDEKFNVNGVLMDAPGDTTIDAPEQVINCRCGLAYEVVDD